MSCSGQEMGRRAHHAHLRLRFLAELLAPVRPWPRRSTYTRIAPAQRDVPAATISATVVKKKTINRD